MISKSWSTSKKRAALYRQAGPLAEFCLQFFPLLVAHSDDYGRLDADPETLKLICDPSSPRPVDEFDAALAQMEIVGLIQRFTADGNAWLQIRHFDEHQPGMLSKRGQPRSPAPPLLTELPPGSGPTKPNLTKPNLTLSSQTPSAPTPGTMSADAEPAQALPDDATPAVRTRPSGRRQADQAQALVDLWNQSVTAPIPQVTKLTTGRRAKYNARLQDFPDWQDWRLVIAWLNAQDWCRAPGTGEHPNWTATLDWLCKSDDKVQQYIERAKADAQRGRSRSARPPGCRHDVPCRDAVEHTQKLGEERLAS